MGGAYFVRKLIVVLLILFCCSLSLSASGALKGEGLNVEGTSVFDKFMQWQRAGNDALNRSIRSLKTEFSLPKYLLLFLLSIGFGVLHSAGPGHGKALVTAYFLKHKDTDEDVSKLSFIISFVHTGTAIILAILFSTILSSLKGIARIKVQAYFSFASGILIFIIGLWFLISKLKGKELGGIREDVDINRRLWVVGVSAGIVPCPIALMIMLITISADIVWIGVTSVLGISFGMYLLLLFVGVVALRSRAGLLKKVESDMKRAHWISEGLSHIAIIAIVFLGLGMTVVFFPFK